MPKQFAADFQVEFHQFSSLKVYIDSYLLSQNVRLRTHLIFPAFRILLGQICKELQLVYTFLDIPHCF